MTFPNRASLPAGDTMKYVGLIIELQTNCVILYFHGTTYWLDIDNNTQRNKKSITSIEITWTEIDMRGKRKEDLQ